MSQQHTINQPENHLEQAMPSHRRFARSYERISNSEWEQRYMKPLREKLITRANGLVLEVGAGNGLNIATYGPANVQHVEIIDPYPTRLGYARERVNTARVPNSLTQDTAE